MPTVEVFADVCCPFTHVGLRRFVEHRALVGRPDVRLVVRSWPLEVVNGTPLDAGFVAEEIAEIRPQVAPDLFVGFDAAAFPRTSVPALALAAAAYAVDVATGEAVSLTLRDTLFEHGRDIADPAVLADVAAAHALAVGVGSLDPAAVLADHAEGQARGVQGSPHFFVRDEGFFCPALDVSRDDAGHLRVTAEPERFARFLDRAFA